MSIDSIDYQEVINKLIAKLEDHSPLQEKVQRDVWLKTSLPSGVYNGLQRNDNTKADLFLVFHAIKNEQFNDGKWLILQLIDMLLPNMKGLKSGKELTELRDEIQQILESTNVNQDLEDLGQQSWQVKTDFVEMPDISTFVDRIDEQERLIEWITKSNCRIVTVTGLKGVGKSKLCAKVVLEIGSGNTSNLHSLNAQEDAFEYIIWRRLLSAPSLSELLEDILDFFADREQIEIPQRPNEFVSLLISYLQSKKCLIVLDNVESILTSGENAGLYLAGFEEYGIFFSQLGTVTHKSCLLINTREKPKLIAELEGANRPIRSFDLEGLNVEYGKLIFTEIGSFSATKEEWSSIIGLYKGNPLILDLVAKHINYVYFGNVANFLKEGKPVFGDLRVILDWHFNRLSELEKEVMYWLAINREPITLSDLGEDLMSITSKQVLPDTLQSLQHKIRLEKSHNGFSLQPVFIEYLTDKIMDCAFQEVISGELEILVSYSILKALSKDYVRETQYRLNIGPLNERFIEAFGTKEIYIEQLNKLIRNTSNQKAGYAAGNLINLLCHLENDLIGYDFSNLYINQAYLQEVRLHNVSFKHSTFLNSVFIQTFGPISSHAFSPNGELLAASEADGSIHIWKVDDMQILWTLQEHISWVFALAFSPDGKILASGSEDKQVKLWDVTTGKLISTYSDHSNSVWTIVFHPNKPLIASGSEDETIKIWDIENDTCVATLNDHTRKVFALDFSKDGSMLASASADRTVLLWDAESWSEAKILSGHTGTVRGVSFSPQGNYIASGSWDKTIKLWRIPEGRYVKTLVGHNEIIHSVAFNHNGELLASSSEDGIIKIWNVENGACQKTLKRHVGEVWKVAFSFDGEHLASGGYDGKIKIWDTQNWRSKSTLQGYVSWVQALALSPDDRFIASSNGDLKIRIWDVKTQQCIKILQGHTGWTFSVAFSSDGKWLASGSDDRSIKLWSVEDWECKKIFLGHDNWVQGIAFNPYSTRIASGSDDRTIKIWDINTGECIKTLLGHNDGVWSVTFDSKGEVVASASEDNTIKLWNIHEGKCIRTFKGHLDRIHSVSISSDDKWLASGSDDKTIKIWDKETGECVRTLSDHESWVLDTAFSHSNKFLVSVSKDKSVKIWDLSTYKCTQSFNGHTAGLWSTCISSNDEMVVSGGEDGSVRLWNIVDGNSVILREPRPYEGLNIRGVKGLSKAQAHSLSVLGAVEV